MTNYEWGVYDCKHGIPHIAGRGEDYDQGYSDQYTKEQNEGAE